MKASTSSSSRTPAKKTSRKPQPVGAKSAAVVAKVKIVTAEQAKGKAPAKARTQAPVRARPGEGAGYQARKQADERCLKEARAILKELGSNLKVMHFAGTRYVLVDREGVAVCEPVWPPHIKRLVRTMRDAFVKGGEHTPKKVNK